MEDVADGDLPPLPLLPAVRPRRLTVSTPSSSTAENGKGDDFMRHYGLFGRLALETRQQILTEAFGHRTLHMYLYNSGPPGHPLYPPVLPLTSQQPSRRWKDRADGLLRRILGKGSGQQQDTTGYCGHCRCGPGPSSPRYPGCMRLKWASCVCHRGEGRGEGVVEDADPRWYMILMQNGLLSAIQTPDMDNCFSHPSSRRVHEGGWQKFVCQEWSEELREVECQVGVLGWLLTCRQAYSDGIEVLFSSNKFHLRQRPLLLNLPRLVLVQRLANIQKLELLWDILPSDHETQGSSTKATLSTNKDLRWLCDALPTMFPLLNELHLSLMGSVQGPGRLKAGREYDAVLATARALLGRIEAMLFQLPRLHEGMQRQQGCGKDPPANALNVAFNCTSFWQAMLWAHDKLGTPGLRAVTDELGVAGKFWKCLGDNGGGYWVCSSGLVDAESYGSAARRSNLESWGLPDTVLNSIDKDGCQGLSCPHELWHGADPNADTHHLAS